MISTQKIKCNFFAPHIEHTQNACAHTDTYNTHVHNTHNTQTRTHHTYSNISVPATGTV